MPPKDSSSEQLGWLQRRNAAIRRYHELGLCPIPLQGKIPRKKGWQTVDQYRQPVEEVLRMFGPEDNVGLLCGVPMQDGRYLKGIDYDDLTMWEEHAANQEIEWLTQGPIVKTGSGKFHHYVLSDDPNKFVFGGREKADHGGEVQGKGTQCVAPPSIHPDTLKEYKWAQEDWEGLPFVPDSLLKYYYPPTKEKKKFAGGRKDQASAEEKTIYKAVKPEPRAQNEGYYDYSTIDFITLFRDRGWVTQETGESVYVLCPNRAQHTKNTDGTSSTVILRTDSGGQRFKCMHGHCDQLSDRDHLVEMLGGPSCLEGYATRIQQADTDFDRRYKAQIESESKPSVEELREIALKEELKEKGIIAPESVLHPPGALGDLTRWMNASTSAPIPVLHVGASLAFAAGLLGHAYQGLSGAKPQIYVVGLAETGTGKEHARTVLRNIADAAGVGNRFVDGEMSGSRALEITMEKRQGRMIWLLDEFGRAMKPILSGGSGSSYQQSLAQAVMKMDGLVNSTYDGQHYADGQPGKNHGKRSVSIKFPVLSIYGTTVPKNYVGILRMEHIADGYINRFLHVRSWDPAPIHRPLNQAFIAADPPEALLETVRRWELLSLEDGIGIGSVPFVAEGAIFEPRKARVILADDDAVRIYMDFEKEIAEWRASLDKDLEGAGDLLGRSAWKVRKVALIVAAADERPVVDGQVMQYAVDLVRYSEKVVEAMLPNIGEDNPERSKQLNSILNYITKQKAKGRSPMEISNRFRNIDKRMRKEYLETLIDGGEIIQMVEGEGSTKKSRFFGSRWVSPQ